MTIVQTPTAAAQSDNMARTRYPGYSVRIGRDSENLVKTEWQGDHLKRLHFDVYLVPARREFVIRHRADATRQDRAWAERWAEGAHRRWDRDAGPRASERRTGDGITYWVSLLGQDLTVASERASIETVDDLARVAKDLGVEVSRIVPPRWATNTDYSPADRFLQHTAEHQAGNFRVSMLRDIYARKLGKLEISDDALISWAVEHGPDIRPDEYEFTIRPDQIDELIAVLQTIKDTMQEDGGRVLRRPADVDEQLRQIDG